MLNKFASLMVVATLVTTGLQADCCKEEKKAPATTTVVEQKKVVATEETTKEEVLKKEEAKKSTLASCGENCGTTVSTPDEEVKKEQA